MPKSFFRGMAFFMIALLWSAPLVAAVKTGEAPAGATIAPLPNPKPGSQWTLRYANGFEGSAVLSEVKDGKFFYANGLVYTDELNMVEGRGARTGAPVSYSPHTRFFSFPLWEGKTWGGWVAWTSGYKSGAYRVEGKAVRWETVTVPAGTFEAMRVETTSDGVPFSTCWYAVRTEFPVKCVFTQLKGRDYELAGYKLVK